MEVDGGITTFAVLPGAVSSFPGNLYHPNKSKLKDTLETVVLGSLAAAVSYFVGDILEGIITR